ncbi:hypothetical protein BASA61_004304 [Batrachochytrium salamandrivorans]|nr:hypothetical protein BASA61_004304 [Batrachochytrium salamandrivorans]
MPSVATQPLVTLGTPPVMVAGAAATMNSSNSRPTATTHSVSQTSLPPGGGGGVVSPTGSKLAKQDTLSTALKRKLPSTAASGSTAAAETMAQEETVAAIVTPSNTTVDPFKQPHLMSASTLSKVACINTPPLTTDTDHRDHTLTGSSSPSSNSSSSSSSGSSNSAVAISNPTIITAASSPKTTPTIPSVSSRFLLRARTSNPSKDIMPGFEEKMQRNHFKLNPGFVLQDGFSFMAYGAQAIAQDEFSKCFAPKPRNSLRSILLKGPNYLLDGFIRYIILFPFRVVLMLAASAIFFVTLPLVLYFNNELWQRRLFKFYCGAFVASWGGRIRYHGKKPRLTEPHIFVSNHTSVIDYVILSAHEFPHATVAQTHGGLIGYFEHSVLTLNGSLMFNRNEKNDRSVLSRKMREHVANPSNVPLLIFPEGTCVNNEYTVLFHKGAFDLGALVVPVAIKYNKSWSDAYWHSKTQSFTHHLLYLMTRWALVADVWYLEPRQMREGQTAVEFSNEVKAEISSVAKLKNLSWDGYFKNFAPPVEKRAQLKQNSQTRYGAILRKRLNGQYGHTRRSSYSTPQQGTSHDTFTNASPIFPECPSYDGAQASTQSKNRVLVALNDSDRRQDMIEAIADKHNNIVDTWKHFSKLRSDSDELRRMENSSWRLWFKLRIEQEKLKQQELEHAYAKGQLLQARLARQRWPSTDSSSVLSIVSSYLPTSKALFGSPSSDDGMIRRARSFGSAMSNLGITSAGPRAAISKHAGSAINLHKNVDRMQALQAIVLQVVVSNNKDYPPLPPTGAKPKSKTTAPKPNPTTTTATTTTTTTTDQPSKNTRFADAVKRRPTHQQLVERQPDFRKAGAAAWLALKRETSVPAHNAPKVELFLGLQIIYASGFPYAKLGDLRKAMQGARIRTSAVRDIRWISRQVVQLLVDADYVSAFTRIITSLDATIVKSFKSWIPRSEAADKDKLAAISSFAAKTVTTIQRSPDVKARNFFRSLLASIGGKTLEAATAEATKIRVQTPDFSISTLETVPKESLPVKKATDKELAAPAVDPPSDMAAEVTSATQDDGATPTVTPIADVEMCL